MSSTYEEEHGERTGPAGQARSRRLERRSAASRCSIRRASRPAPSSRRSTSPTNCSSTSKAADGDAIEQLRVARRMQAGWTLDENGTLEDPRPIPRSYEPITARRRGRQCRCASTRRRRGRSVSPPRPTPGSCCGRRVATTSGSAESASNHVLTTDSLGPFRHPFKANPFKANPFKANPFKANPFKANAVTVGIDSYAVLGFGGLQPVTYLGPEPAWRPVPERPGRRDLRHRLRRAPLARRRVIVIPPYLRSGEPIGIRPDPPPIPKRIPSLAEPLDGIFDDAAGHGTFIAGIVRQECPDALILPVRIADGTASSSRTISSARSVGSSTHGRRRPARRARRGDASTR